MVGRTAAILEDDNEMEGSTLEYWKSDRSYWLKLYTRKSIISQVGT